MGTVAAIENLPPLHVYSNLDLLCAYHEQVNQQRGRSFYLVEEPAGWRTLAYTDNLYDPDGEYGHEYESYGMDFTFRLWIPATQYLVVLDSVRQSLKTEAPWEIWSMITRMTWSPAPLSSLDDPVILCVMPNIDTMGHPCMNREYHLTRDPFDPETQVNRAQQLLTAVIGAWHHQPSNADLHDHQVDTKVWDRLGQVEGRTWEHTDSLVDALRIWEDLGEDAESVLFPKTMTKQTRYSELTTWRKYDENLPEVILPRATPVPKSA